MRHGFYRFLVSKILEGYKICNPYPTNKSHYCGLLKILRGEFTGEIFSGFLFCPEKHPLTYQPINNSINQLLCTPFTASALLPGPRIVFQNQQPYRFSLLFFLSPAVFAFHRANQNAFYRLINQRGSLRGEQVL